jgi:ferritin-like metal-binding protein YciE
MKVKDMSALYVESLKDLYSAETQLIEALPKVMEAATSRELKQAVKSHLAETKQQAERVGSIIESLGEEPGGHTCKAMQGLIRETDDLIRDVQDPMVLDAALIGGAQKVEHYEISGYGTARTFASLLGFDDHATDLQKNLDEEYGANDKLGEIAQTMVNERAMRSKSGSKPREMAGAR